MRENRTCGSEGGEGNALPDPYHDFLRNPACTVLFVVVDTRDKPGHDAGVAVCEVGHGEGLSVGDLDFTRWPCGTAVRLLHSATSRWHHELSKTGRR